MSQAEPATCPDCGAQVPPEARFCPSCGSSLEAGSTAVIPPPPHETGRVPVAVASSEPHLFGVTPPLALLVLAAAAIALGALLLGLGHVLPGVLLLVLGAVLLGLHLVTSRGARTRALGDRLRASATALGARSAATREATRLRHELARVEDERDDRLRALGAAVHAGDDASAAAARADAEEVDRRLADLRERLDLVVPRARERVARARLEAQPTERVDLGSRGSSAED